MEKRGRSLEKLPHARGVRARAPGSAQPYRDPAELPPAEQLAVRRAAARAPQL